MYKLEGQGILLDIPEGKGILQFHHCFLVPKREFPVSKEMKEEAQRDVRVAVQIAEEAARKVLQSLETPMAASATMKAREVREAYTAAED